MNSRDVLQKHSIQLPWEILELIALELVRLSPKTCFHLERACKSFHAILRTNTTFWRLALDAWRHKNPTRVLTFQDSIRSKSTKHEYARLCLALISFTHCWRCRRADSVSIVAFKSNLCDVCFNAVTISQTDICVTYGLNEFQTSGMPFALHPFMNSLWSIWPSFRMQKFYLLKDVLKRVEALKTQSKQVQRHKEDEPLPSGKSLLKASINHDLTPEIVYALSMSAAYAFFGNFPNDLVGASPMQRWTEWSPLMACAFHNKPDLLRSMIPTEKFHKFINARTSSKITVLMVASFRGHIEVVRLLLTGYPAPADMSRIDRFGMTAWSYAVSNLQINIIKYVASLDECAFRREDWDGVDYVRGVLANNLVIISDKFKALSRSPFAVHYVQIGLALGNKEIAHVVKSLADVEVTFSYNFN